MQISYDFGILLSGKKKNDKIKKKKEGKYRESGLRKRRGMIWRIKKSNGIRANRRAVEELRGDEGMCEALLEIMEPEIMKIKEETRQETMREAILRAVEGFRDLGADDDRIKEILKKKYAFSDEEAEKYL